MSLIEMQLGHYTLTRLIGSGGMGEVYLAQDIKTHRQVAIKVLREEQTAFSEMKTTLEAERLFQREMSIITALDHPYILPMYDYGEEVMHKTKLTYMVMPYRQEGSLDDWLQQRGTNEPLSPQDTAFLLQQAGEALQCAHDHNIVHQDVKTSNFLIWEVKERPNRPNLLLADFGIAKTLSATSSSSQSVRGTPAFMPPEQWDGHPVYASDQYALAVLAYLLLTGRRPFTGGLEQVMRQHYFTTPQPPSTINPRLSAAIDTVILRALEKSPANRYPSVTAFVQAFQQAVSYQPVYSASNPPTPVLPLSNPPAPTPSTGGDLHATLTITPAEAFTGGMRSLKMPGGRSINVQIPSGAYNSQTIRLNGMGEPYYPGGPAGAMIITLSVAPAERVSDSNIPNPINGNKPVSFIGNQNEQKADLNKTVFDSPIGPTVPAMPFPIPTLPPKPSRSNRRLAVIVLVAVAIIVILSSGTIFAVNTINTNNANATTTANSNSAIAHVNATNTAGANAGATAFGQSNTDATSTAVVEASATAAVIIPQTPNPYPPNTGTPAIYDPLNGKSQDNNWDNNSACQFTGGTYQASSQATFLQDCDYNATPFGNFAFEVYMKILKGDCGGIIFRGNMATSQYYLFFVCQDGTYALYRYVDNTGTDAQSLILPTSSSAINQGYNKENIIAVVANRSSINLYVNHKLLNSITDSNYSSGTLALTANAPNSATTVAFNNARAWTL